MPDRNGDTPLLLAAKEGHNEVVTSLAQYNIDVEMADAQGNPCIRHTHTALALVPNVVRL